MLFNKRSSCKKDEYLAEILKNNYQNIEFNHFDLNCLSDHKKIYSAGRNISKYEPDDLDEIMESDLIYFLKNESPKKFLYYTIRAVQSEYFLGPKVLRLLFEVLMSLQSTYDETSDVEEIIFKVISILELSYSKYNTCDITCRDGFIDCLSRKCEITTGLPLKCSLATNFIELLFMLINYTLQMEGHFEETFIQNDLKIDEYNIEIKKSESSCVSPEKTNHTALFDHLNDAEEEDGKNIDF